MFENAQWIWAEDNTRRNDRVLFRKKIVLEKVPKTVPLRIGASDSYHLYVNGKPVVYDGGLPRESAPGSGYYDEVDIAKYLSKGENVLGFACWYRGRSGNGAKDAGAAGLLVESPIPGLLSDADFTVYRPVGYGTAEPPSPSGLYTGDDLLFDAGKDGDIAKVFDIGYGSTLFVPATTYGEYPCAPWGELYARSLPLYRFDAPTRIRRMDKRTEGTTDTYEAELGEAMLFAPILELTAMGTEKIELRTDRYLSAGEWDDAQTYRNQKVSYICKNGVQVFESALFLSGTRLIITAPATVKIQTVSYRRTHYGAEAVGKFMCEDERIDRLVEKCKNTLDVTLRDNFWDSPDRGRGTTLAQLSVAARAAMLIYDESLLPLVKKAILDCAEFSGDALQNNALSPRPEEVPAQALLAIGESGVLAAYYDRTGDEALMEQVHASCARYLTLWDLADDGRLICREGDRRFYDGGSNIDGQLLETCLYYSACKFLLRTAFAAGDTDYTDTLTARVERIAETFEALYRKPEGYASGDWYDDRANAFAVLSGLAAPDAFPALRRLLATVQTASAQTEGYVLEALIAVGGVSDARTRLLSRYTEIFDSDNPTMPEYFGVDTEGGAVHGALCHSGSVSPLTVLLQGFAGVTFAGGKRVTVTPRLSEFASVRYTVSAMGGPIRGWYRKDARCDVLIDNDSTAEVTVVFGGKKVAAGRGKSKYND